MNETHKTVTGGDLLAEMLRLHRVGPMFGMGGFQLLPFYAAVNRLGLDHHLVADERSGAWAADAYARASGRVGVCDGTLGPGATNLITALVESLNAGVPVVALVGGANRLHRMKNLTQEAEQELLLRPAAKAFIRVEDPARIPELVRRAFATATAGRPGPVVLEIPEDVCHAITAVDDSQLYAQERTQSVPGMRSSPDPVAVAEAADLLARSCRPVLLVGGGIHASGAYAEVRRLSETLKIPVAQTISGKGALPCTHELSVGVFGRYSRIANALIEKADCLLAVGTKLGEIATKRFELIPTSVPMIQLDVVPEEVGRTTRVDVALVGDAALGLTALLEASDDRVQAQRAAYLREVTDRKRAWLAEAQPRLTSTETPINVARLINELNAVMPADSTLVADGGFASHWTALFYETKVAGPGYIADRGFASIGYGLPATLGARFAHDADHPVVGITGDGGLNMVLGELETVARVGKPLTLIVVNNAASGYVKALQHAMFDGRFQSADLSDVDYADVARAFGWLATTVRRPDDLRPSLDGALAERERPVLLDVKVTRDPSQMLPGIDSRLTTPGQDELPASRSGAAPVPSATLSAEGRDESS